MINFFCKKVPGPIFIPITFHFQRPLWIESFLNDFSSTAKEVVVVCKEGIRKVFIMSQPSLCLFWTVGMPKIYHNLSHKTITVYLTVMLGVQSMKF